MEGKWIRKGDVLWDNPFSDDFGQSYYKDRKGVIWHFKIRRADSAGDGSDGPPGWYHIEARPKTPGDAYGIGVGRYPVSAWSSFALDSTEGGELMADAIDNYVNDEDGGGWFWLLFVAAVAWALSKEKRR